MHCKLYNTHPIGFQVLGLVLFAIVFLVEIASAQIKPKRVASIPFEMVGSYVVISVKINDSSPLNLILDSGIRNTIITELQEGDAITLNYSDVKDLLGLGGGTHQNALVSNSNTLKIGKIKLESKQVYVLQDSVFGLSRHSGTKINGLIGVDFFRDYAIEINYSNKRITFYEPTLFDTPKGFTVLPISVEGQKLFVDLVASNADGSHQTVKMLIDTGAELNAWFQTLTTQSVHIPQKWIEGTIGEGLNGIISGKFGQIPEICFGEHCIINPIVSFPDSASINGIIGNSKRDGTIGSQLLSRFNIIIDYQNKRFFFKPNENFRKPFSYNVAGIELVQYSNVLPIFEVLTVWSHSPAERAGIKSGDILTEINGQKTVLMTISEIRKILETPSKRTLDLRLMRENKEIVLEIDMRDKIKME